MLKYRLGKTLDGVKPAKVSPKRSCVHRGNSRSFAETIPLKMTPMPSKSYQPLVVLQWGLFKLSNYSRDNVHVNWQ